MTQLTLADRVAETTETTGTGALDLAGAVAATYQTFVDGCGNGATVPYVIVHRTAAQWEVGRGVITDGTPDTLTRAEVFANSSGTFVPLSLSAGTKDVFLTVPAEKWVAYNADSDILRLPGQLQVNNITDLSDNILAWGDSATGTNTAATSFTFDAPLSTGNATPAALIMRVGVQGASGATPQVATEAFRVQEVANATSREVAAWNVTGPVMGRIPTNAATILLENADGGRFLNRVKVIRNSTPVFQGVRYNGTADSPTAAVSNDFVFSFEGYGYDGSTARRFVGGFAVRARENITPTAAGGSLILSTNRLGTLAQENQAEFRSGGVGITEWIGASTTRLISGATQIAIRDSGNTADTFTVNAAGTAIYAPIATAFGVGTASNNAAAILQADSTTRGFLPPRMTTAQRDAISTPPAGLMIYNTSTNKLNVYTTAWEAITSA